MKKLYKMIALSVSAVVACTVLNMALPQDASAQTATTQMCFRARTISVPTYLVSRYQASGATIGACQVTPSL